MSKHDPLRRRFAHHEEAVAVVAAPREQVFAFIDDPSRLGGHMSRSSWMLGGGRMRVELDTAAGHAVGSRMRLEGHALGVPVSVQTEVVERDPPTHKAWRTVGTPRLLVIGAYRMSVDIERAPGASRAIVGIDYAVPGLRVPPMTWLARAYALWCVRRMATDIVAAFATGFPHHPRPVQ